MHKQMAKRGEQLPYDEGAAAYKSKVSLTKNPYLESEVKNSEWDKRWMAECDMDDSDSYDWSANKFKEN